MPPAPRAVRVLALAICLVLVSGVLAARGLEGGSRTTVVAAGGGAPDVPVAAQLGSSVIVDPLPSLPATTAAPPPTPTTRPARPALTVPALPVTVPRLPLPTTAPFPQVPPELGAPGYPGQSEWTAVSGGIHLHLATSPARPRAGDVVHFTAEATSAALPCCGMALLFGDGYQVAQDMSWSCPGGGPRSAGTARLETTHVYNGDGRRTFMLNAVTGNCEVAAGTGEMHGSFDVAAGTVTGGQGPERPTVRVDTWGGATDPPRAADELQLAVEGADADGFVTGFHFDWGDGTTSDGPGDPIACRPSDTGWPLPSRTWLPRGGGSDPPPAHHYTVPGTYLVTVTVSSAGCDGSGVQQASATLTWTRPG